MARIDGTNANDALDGSVDPDQIYGEGGDDVIQGHENDDQLFGGLGDDTLHGDAGNDLLDGGQDSDSLNGGTGNDTIIGGEGADIIRGESGSDVLDYSKSDAGIQIDLSDQDTNVVADKITAAVGAGGHAEGDIVRGMDNVIGSDFDDTIGLNDFGDGNFAQGGAGNDSITGSAGNNTLSGGAGSDTITGGSGSESISGGDGADTITGGLGDDSISMGLSRDLSATDDDNDLLVLEDGFGDDTIEAFEAPTDFGREGYEGNDQLDVTNLTDARGNPVDVDDVTVTDTNGDGTGDAILQFPNGESITLKGVPSSDVSSDSQLIAMGIPDARAASQVNIHDAIELDGSSPADGTILTTADGDLVEVDDQLAFTVANAASIVVGDTTSIDGVAYTVTNVTTIEADVTYNHGADTTTIKSFGMTLDGGANGTLDYIIPVDAMGNLPNITQIEVVSNTVTNDVSVADTNSDQTVTLSSGPDYIVEGTDRADLINGSYTDDPDGDMIDNSDHSDGSDDDSVVAGDGNDTVRAGEGRDTVYGGADNDSLSGEAGADTLHGDAGDDTLHGGAEADWLFGGADQDSLYGDAGNDWINTGTGDDFAQGGADQDTFIVQDGFGNDTIEGGETGSDIDTLRSYMSGNSTLDLTAGGTSADNESGTLTSGGGADVTSFTEIEQVDLGSGDDHATGSDADDEISMGDGADTIEAGGGDDFYLLGSADGDVDTVVLSDGDGQDTVGHFEAPTYSSDGTLTGNDQLDVSGLTSDGGTTPVTTADVVVSDTNGDGTGYAILTFPGGESITLIGVSTTQVDSAEELVAMGIPAVSLNYIVEGTASGELINAGYGGDPQGDRVDANDNLAGNNDDSIQAGGGNDTIGSGMGDDTVDTGSGNDIVYAEGGNDSLIGGLGNDSLFGEGDNDTILGDEGADSIDGGEGDDSLVGGIGNDTLWGKGGEDTIYGGDNDDFINGGFDDDYIEGGGGDDWLEGWYGEDTIHGGDGHDFIDADNDSDVVYAGDGNDTVMGGYSISTDTIYGGGGNDSLNGQAGDDLIYGGTGDDVQLGTDGNDTFFIEDDFGADTITGGETDETSGDTLDLSATTTGVTVDLTNANPETGTVSDGTDTAEFTEIENIVLGGGRDTIELADGSGADAVHAFDMTDSGDGTTNDQLDVSALTSDGGTTPVTASDVTLSDTNGDGTGDAILTFPGGESITLIGVLPTQVDTIPELVSIGIPDGLDFIVEGSAGDDTIDVGYLGDPEGDRIDNLDHSDSSNDDSVEAYAGDDLIHSGEGEDTVWAGEDNDTVYAGNDADHVYGEEGDDVLYGEAGTDTMYGDAGNDLVEGGSGNDSLSGGADRDTIFGGLGADKITGDAGNDQIDGGDEADQIFGDEGQDTIEGGDGADTIEGGTDEDLIFGGAGGDDISGDEQSDTVYGGAGNDDIDLGDGDDVGIGGAGDDTLHGGVGDDQIFGDEPLSVAMSPNSAQGSGTGGAQGSNLTDFPTDNMTFEMQFNGDGMATSGPDDPALTSTLFSYGTAGSPAELSVYGVSDNEVYDLSTPADPNDTVIETGYVTVEVNGTSYTTAIESSTIFDGTDHSIAVTFDADSQEVVLFVDGAPAENISLIDDTPLETGGTLIIGQSQSGQGGFAGEVTDVRLWDEIRSDAEINQFDDIALEDEAGDPALVSNWLPDPFTSGFRDDIGNNNLDGTGDTQVTTAPGAGNDEIYGGDGSDTIIGTAGNDTLDGDNAFDEGGADLISGGSGDDQIIGDVGDDTLLGGSGNDEIYAGDDNDMIRGGSGADTIYGQSGNDTIDASGSDGAADVVSGGDDRDYIYAGANDNVDGGAGGDDFDTLDLSGSTSTGGSHNIVITNADSNGNGYDGYVEYFASSGAAEGQLNFTEIESIICFTEGTVIRTTGGERPIESLRIGDKVLTRDNGLQPIRWIGQRTVLGQGSLAPVSFAAGSLRDVDKPLLVSPQHRMLFTGYQAEMLFGQREVLIPAKHLVNGAGITQTPCTAVTYIHIMFDSHEIIYANGQASESFFAGETGLDAVESGAREELFNIFPELRWNSGAHGQTARRCLKAFEAELFIRAEQAG